MKSSERQAQLKKRLFILAGYLVITACLLAYVSYSSYRLKIEANIVMPKAYKINASIGVTYEAGEDPEHPNQNGQSISPDEVSVELNPYNALVGLAPGTEAKTYALKSVPEIADNHLFVIEVDNLNEDNASPSALDLYYTLEVETNGRLPLTFVIKEEENGEAVITASAVTDCTTDETTTSCAFKNTSGKPVVFKLDGTDRMKVNDPDITESELLEGSSNTHKIYIGWNDASSRANDIDLCREVDKITIKAKIYAAEPTLSTSESLNDLPVPIDPSANQ